MNTHTYAQIAASYPLWQEYVDPSGLTTQEGFDAMTTAEKIEFQVKCFGAEEEQ